MMRWTKAAASLVLSVSLLLGGAAAVPETAAASSTAEKWLLGIAATAYISHYYSNLDNHGQTKLLSEVQKQTGVYESAAYDNRVRDIYDRIADTGTVARSYEIYVSPDEDINAFMSLGGVLCVNKGTLDAMDDDELAYIMAHEIAHGEKRHSVSGIKKQMTLLTALTIYTSDDPSFADYMLSTIAANYISNAVFTKDQEKEADHLGFEYLTEAGYNPGAGAAAMQVLYDKYGESSPSGIKAVLMPGNHPKTSDRINKNVKWMNEYSGKHVDVKDSWIIINGEKTFQPEAYGKYTNKERAYLVAGKLAEVYHKGNVPDAAVSGNEIHCGTAEIYTFSTTEDGSSIADALNKGIQKNRGQAVKDHYEIDKAREKIAKQNEEANEDQKAASEDKN